jgi:hypothetical protein
VNGSLFASSKSRDKTPNANSSGPVNLAGGKEEGIFNSFAERKHAIMPDCDEKPAFKAA